MDNYKNNIYDRVIVNNDREFIENDSIDVTASFVILCENDIDNELGKPVYDCNILGLSFFDWVSMACIDKPVRLHIEKDEKFLNLIKPYMGGCDYTVVLYADTPLISKSHLIDLIGYVSRKRLNVCKLKRGYILKNEYIAEIDEIYSSLVYDLSSNDFLQVKTISDYDSVKDILEKRLFNFHKKNGVTFCNQNSTCIDANVKIGRGAFIYGSSSIINNSVIGNNVTISPNVSISNSKIEDNVEIKSGTIISGSVVKSGVIIGSGSNISNSVINKNIKIGMGSLISKSAINEDAKINDFVCLKNANITSGTIVGDCSVIVGDGAVVGIVENSVLSAGTKIIKKNQVSNEDN